MKNKGFTLIELLGVIVVLTIISLITIPIIDSSLNKGKDNLSKTQEKQIIKGLKDYYAEHLSEFNDIADEEVCKNIGELKDSGYLPASIINPKTHQEYDNSKAVCVVKKVDNNYNYYIK